MTRWNKKDEPISTRLRDPDEILKVVEEKTLMYNKITNKTAIISDVFLVEQDKNSIKEGYTIDEDRWVEYITEDGPLESFSTDLDEDHWIWHDELEKTR